jgi:hypothetical protein
MEGYASGDADLNHAVGHPAGIPAYRHPSNRMRAGERPEMIWRGDGLIARNAPTIARCGAPNIEPEPACPEVAVNRIKSA